jgi:hypothetical protein
MADHCPTCGFDASSVSPPDAVVTLRSLPRRFNELLEEAEPDQRPPILDHAGQAAEAVAEIGAAPRLALIEDSPALDSPTADAATRDRPGGVADSALDRLAAAVDTVVGAVANQPGEAWNRPATTPAGPTTAGDLLRAAAHAGVHHLRLAAPA